MEPWSVSKYPELFPHVYIVFIIKLTVYKMLISSCWELSKAIRLLFSFFRQQMMSTNQVHQSFQSMSRRNRKSRKDRKERERQKKKRK